MHYFNHFREVTDLQKFYYYYVVIMHITNFISCQALYILLALVISGLNILLIKVQ